MADNAENYDLSEFAPKVSAPNSAMNSEYDLSEFAPNGKELNPNVLKRIPGALGIIKSDINDVARAIPGAISKQLRKAPGYVDYLTKNAPAAASLVFNDPKLVGKNAVAGSAEMLGGISRIPPDLANYLAHIGMIKPETAKAMPQPFSENEVKQWGNEFVGANKPGGELIRGIFRNTPALYGGLEAGRILDPRRYFNKNIASGVLEQERKQIATHSKYYDKIWNEAEKSGFNQVPIDTNKLSKNLEIIEKYKTPKEYESLKNLISHPTLQNAQVAQSDMGVIHRKLQEKSRNGALLSEEKAIYTAAKDAEQHIEENMFKNAKGEINKSLQKKYGKLTQSYRENVVPYKYNPDIQGYKNREMLDKELVDKLKRGEFAAKKGGVHPEITRRDTIKTLAKYGAGAGALHMLGLDRTLLDALMEKNKKFVD